MSEYTITKEIRSQTKVGFGIYIFDFMFLVLYGIFSFFLKELVHEQLRVVYGIFSGAMALFLTAPSVWNRMRRNYQSIFLYLRRDDALYRPVKNVSKGDVQK